MRALIDRLQPLRQRLQLLKLADIVLLLGFNTLCALLNSLTTTNHLAGDVSVLLLHWREYALLYNSLTLSMLGLYLLLMDWHSASVRGWRLLYLVTGTYLLAFALCAAVFDWYQRDKIAEGLLYMLNFMVSASWLLLLAFYLKQRVISPRLQALTAAVDATAAARDRMEAELHLLQAQLEPHFFFNTLANLHNLIDLDPDKAKLLLEQLTAYLRDSIPQFRQTIIALEAELGIIERYLQIQQIRFAGRFQYQLDIDAECRHVAVLPMALLSLVENAIKHGLEKTSGSGLLTLRAYREQQQLVLQVCDSAAQPSHHQAGTGLRNLRARLAAAYGAEAQFCLETQAGQHTCATVRCPWRVMTAAEVACGQDPHR
jgi:signal transduction histidine kinase